MVKDTLKQIGREMVKFIIFLLKLGLLAILFLWFGYDSVIVFPVPQLYVLVIYYGVMLICLFAFITTFFEALRLKGYLIFTIFLIIYTALWFNFTPIVNQHKADKCLDSGQGVWDYERHICRKDCWHWDKEYGCYKKETP